MSKHRTHGTLRNRLLSGLLCLALVLGLLPAGTVLPVRAASWAEPYGQQLVEWGIMQGDSRGLRLDDTITRAEFVTLVNKAFGYNRLGGMPFTDVPSNKWYAEEIDIAYNAGYFKGRSETIADPDSPLRRDEAAVLLARNLMLQPAVGESEGFTDSRTLGEWSRGLIAAAVEEGVLSGYGDGSFRPYNQITRGEMAAMLVRAIGTPVSESGDYSLGGVYGNVVVSSSGVTLRDTTIAGNLYLTGGIDLGDVLLQNVTVLGRIVVSGAGESHAGEESVVLRNVVADELVVDSVKNQFVTILAQGVTDIPVTRVRTDAYLNDSSDSSGFGLQFIEMLGEGGRLQLAGSVKEVVNKAPFSGIQLVQGWAQTITVDEYATNSWVEVGDSTRADRLNLDVAATVTGKGDINNLKVSSDGSTVGKDILPDIVEIRPGVSDTILGAVSEKEPISSTEAAQLSAEPRLLAGYPKVVDIAPTQAKGVFSASKPGTIYWAVSAVSEGSVSAANLISNPAYGGNIFQKQAGKIEATAANTEYTANITKLLPDGAYYLSTVMVDKNGKQSPLKVVTFSTPDNTKPDFNPTPKDMSKKTTTVAQVTATANKNCLLYYVLLPTKAPPTAQQFKAQSFGANFGSGTVNMVKNLPISITVNRSKLQEKTTYYLYLWLTDHEGGAQSMDRPVEISFTTLDETPPFVTGLEQLTPSAATSARINFSVNEAPATLFWAVVPSGKESSFIRLGSTDEETADIMGALNNKIKVEFAGQSDVTASGKTTVASANLDIQFTINGLNDPDTNSYTLYYVAKDAAGNYSERVGYRTIRTRDTKAPTVKYEFTSINGDNAMEPLADSGIKLVFSETVKGGQYAEKTFLELYQDMVNAQNGDREKEARDEFVKVMSEHIQLYYMHTDNNEAELITATLSDYGMVDFSKAIVRMENYTENGRTVGKLVVFLPGDTDVSDSDNIAVTLNSGATYFVQLQDVWDDPMESDPANPLGNVQGNLKMDNFKVMYAQVNLVRRSDVPKITQPDGAGGSDSLENIRLDIVVDVIPKSTEKVPPTECWDMIIWSDTWVELEIYRIELDDRQRPVAGAAWKPVGSATIADSALTPGIGLGTNVIGSDPAATLGEKYPVLKETLVEGRTYRYGIHITSVRGISEVSKTAEADSWSDLITMRFGLVAGALDNVRNASSSVYTSFNSAFQIQGGANVSYISTATNNGVAADVLECPKQFTDIRIPEFQGDYPKFTVGSGSIDMELALNRPGYIYYVVAEAGVITTGINASTLIRPGKDGNDGEAIDQAIADKKETKTKKELLEDLAAQTYIPTSGTDRDAYKNYIYFMTGGMTEGEGRLEFPVYGNITGAKGFYAGQEGVFAPDGSLHYTTARLKETVSGLKPDTTYYIYMVLGGTSSTSHAVQVYRAKTSEVKVPAINVLGISSSSVTMQPTEDCELAFALVELNRLPDFFGKYIDENGEENTSSIIWQIINPKNGSSGKSVFDADVTNEETRAKVANYVLGNTYSSGANAPTRTWKIYNGETNNKVTYKGTIPADTIVPWILKDDMPIKDLEYVLLVVGRHPYGGTLDEDGVRQFSGNDYGFGGVKTLFTEDENAPEFTDKNSVAIDAGVGKPNDVDDDDWNNGTWQKKATSYSYNGILNISFNKNLYWQDNKGIRHELTYANLSDAILITTKEENAITPAKEAGSVGNTISLKLNNVRHGDTITLPASGMLCNGSGYSTKYIIRLTFSATLTGKDYGDYITDVRPGFRVTITNR